MNKYLTFLEFKKDFDFIKPETITICRDGNKSLYIGDIKGVTCDVGKRWITYVPLQMGMASRKTVFKPYENLLSFIEEHYKTWQRREQNNYFIF